MMKDKFQMSSMGELIFFLGLQVTQKKEGIFISQDKYVAEILRKFGYTEGKSASTPIDTEKPLLKDPDGEDVDVHTYMSMIGSLMYLTSSRPDIMFAVCACARFQVTPKDSHLHVVKRIFRYLKGKPHLGLWYPKDSPFDLVAYSDSDYAGASLDKKSKTGGCQFFGCRLIFWQCKKQTVVATSSTEAEYVVAASCRAKVLWIQNQLLDYGVGPSTKLTFYKAFFSSQWKFLIHTILQSLSAKRTSWNEFSSAMASVVICLSTALDACATLTKRVEHLEYNKVAQALEIIKLKRRVKKLEKGRMIDEMDKDDAVALMDDKEEEKKEKEAKLKCKRRRKGVVIRDLEEESSIVIPADTKSKNKGKGIMVEEPKPLKKKKQVEMDKEYARKLHTELNKDIDWDVAIDHVKQKAKEDSAVQSYQVMKKRPQTEAQARKNMIMYLKNVAGFRLDYFKGMSYDDIRLIFKAKFNSNIEFLLKTKEQMEEEESGAQQSINKTLAHKATKKRKLNEEVEDLKRHHEIVPDEL
nr:uncharacterized mitochondrial protein AtMg00810-like [Tanacetum cinerariifolium]